VNEDAQRQQSDCQLGEWVGKNPAQHGGHSVEDSLTHASRQTAAIHQVVLELLDEQISDNLDQ
jgi:hypothetical protein